jgi:3-methyladenine DNA glycosylase AlkD
MLDREISMTTVDEVLTTLKRLGKPQTAAIYRRHGSGDNVFGVLTSEITKLHKKIKSDHALAMELWKTGNAEACTVAVLIADPAKLTRAELNRWIKDGPIHFVGCYLSNLVARTKFGETAMRDLMKSPNEFRRELGYSIFSIRLKNSPSLIGDLEATQTLKTIEKEIHLSPNWARYAMNSAIISIGIFKPNLRDRALDVAKRIGKVDVDHGQTTCKTPDAAASILKASKRKRLCP